MFEKYDSDQDNKLGLNELVVMFQEISNRLTSLPATAQVADQQGKYLGKKFNRFQSPKALKSIDHNQLANSDFDELLFDPFVYRHLGSLACLSFFSYPFRLALILFFSSSFLILILLVACPQISATPLYSILAINMVALLAA